MITTKVHFDVQSGITQEIDFLILPKLGETISYGSKNSFSDYRVDRIVHKVNIETNNSSQVLDIYVSKAE